MIGVTASNNGHDVALALAVVVVPAFFTLLGASLGRWADARNRRRDKYAEAVQALVRWAEYPYRVRRRTSDDPSERFRLTELGHELQEQLQCNRTWIAAESRRVGRIYGDAITKIKGSGRPALVEAWRTAPSTSGSDAVLDGWGPDAIDDVLQRLNQAISCRFGWRRLVFWLPRLSDQA